MKQAICLSLSFVTSLLLGTQLLFSNEVVQSNSSVNESSFIIPHLEKEREDLIFSLQESAKFDSQLLRNTLKRIELLTTELDKEYSLDQDQLMRSSDPT